MLLPCLMKASSVTEVTVSHFMTPHPNLQDTPLTHPDLILFTGHTVKMKENFQADYAITNQYELLERGNLSQADSSQ